VYVTSTPSGAAIWLDGVNTGQVTPATLLGVPEGIHQLVLILTGYQDWGQSVVVTTGQTAPVSAVLIVGGAGTNLIAFSSDRTGNWEIYLMNTDGSNQRNVTSRPGTDDDEPFWSPDGRQIAFVSCPVGQEASSEIWVMNSDGSNQRQITFNSAEASQPGWSPDGTTIAFASTKGGGGGVWLMNADGSNVHKIIDDPARWTRPRFSPDGSQIAFRGSRAGNAEVYVMNADGTNLRNLTNNPAWDGWPSWSPNGQQIVFATDRDGPPDMREIYLMSPDGSGLTRLTDNPANDTGPEWTPDPQWILFESDRDGDIEQYKMRADGTEQINLSNYPGAIDWDGIWGIIR